MTVFNNKKSSAFTKLISMLIIALMFITSCQSNSKSYKNDISASDLMADVQKLIVLDNGYMNADEDYIEFYFDDVKYIEDFAISFAADSSSNITEIGIFRADSAENTSKLLTVVDSYIKAKKDSWMASINYTPEEFPKIDQADYKQFGNYVVYTILTEEDGKKVFDLIEENLIQK